MPGTSVQLVYELGQDVDRRDPGIGIPGQGECLAAGAAADVGDLRVVGQRPYMQYGQLCDCSAAGSGPEQASEMVAGKLAGVRRSLLGFKCVRKLVPEDAPE